MRALAAACCVSLVGLARAQTSQAGGLALESTKTWDLPRAWELSVGPSLEYRPLFASDDAEATAPPPLRNLDLNLAVERRWLERWSFGSSLRLRARYAFSDEAAREIRPWLYATRTGDIRYVRFAQRFRTELRLRGDRGEPLEATWRHRYQFALERALAGLVAEDGEWSFSASAELLVSTDQALREATSVGLRPYVGLARDQYAIGVEYRLEDDVDAGSRDHAWLLVLILDL